MFGIDLNAALEYRAASFRYFEPHEHHGERICADDVLLMVFDGALRFCEDGESFELLAGDYHIQKHNSYQAGPVESDSPKYLYVHFYGEWRDSAFALPRSGRFSVDAMMPDMKRMDKLVYSSSSTVDKLSAFYSILSKLAASDEEAESEGARIVRVLTEDITKTVTLSQLSEKFHYSKNHIINLVKKEYGVTPCEYLKNERVRYAARLMESTSASLENIAEMSGFSDYTRFFRAFRDVYGISPRKWRERKQKEPAKLPIFI